jgi:formimidoylglutamate deiminase
MAATYIADIALCPEGWRRRVRIDIDDGGTIARAAADSPPAPGAETVAGIVLPGMPNVHCHAFQRAMIGLTQRVGPAADDFWTWREVMYRFLARLDPDQIEAIATQLYVEMLKAGYTAVVEFHYVHNGPDGRPYADRAELAERIVAAARTTGIRLTLLPVLYQTGNFGGAPPAPGQKRFLLGDDAFARLVSDLAARYRGAADVRLGIAPHSLRAVPPAALARALAAVDAIDPRAPIHIHAAEQTKEVDDSLAWSGKRPVEWLLDNAPVGPRWTLIHATHMTTAETRRLAACGATVGLCPTTEADLGDGIFPLLDYATAKGRFGIGSDSNVGVAPAEELRWMEYAQRLARRKRNLATHGEGASIGAELWRAALAGGAAALAQPVGALAPGQRADLIVLDPAHASLIGLDGDAILDGLVFGGGTAAITGAMVGGRWRVRDRRHAAEDAAARRFAATMRALA